MTLAPAARPNPYIGPRSFQTGEVLYGRDRETQDLLGLLIAERIVLLHSPSGAGKTSLVQAALIPRLIEREFTVLRVIRVSQEPPALANDPSTRLRAGERRMTDGTPNDESILRPSSSVVNRYVLSALLALEEGLPPEQQMPLAELAGMSLNEYLDRRLSGEAAESVVLIFDQFEEILTVDPTNLEAKHAFFAQVGAALRNRRRWALFSMREDYVAALDPYVRPVPTRLNNTCRLDMLGADAARAAIQEPARGSGAEFETAAARQLIEDLSRVQVQRADGEVEEHPGPWVEPVQLQVVCYRLWSRLPEGARHIGMGEIETLGNVDTALSDYYAEHVAEVAAKTGAGERAIREWFDRALITPERRRGQVLQTHEQSQGLANSAIWPLIDAYLVRAEKRRGATWFELAHDRLITPVRANNAAWREAHLSLIQRQADLWNSQARPDGLLLRDADLVEAEAWAAEQATLTDIERAFLARCQEVREIVRRARRNKRLITILAIVASVIGLAAAALAVYAWFQRDEAVRARGDASSRQLAAQSSESRAAYPQRALLLAAEAVARPEEAIPPAAKSALYAALASGGGVPLRGHAEAITALAFSPDGRYLATGSADNSTRLWNLSTPGAPPALLQGHRARIVAVVFSPDGRYLATGSADNTARLWSVASPAADPIVLRGHARVITALAFSPDGRILATGSGDTTARLWDLSQSPPRSVALEGHQEPITTLAFSPNGRMLATGSADTTVRLWDLAKPDTEPPILKGHESGITALAFSPDGRTLATGSDDATARLWDLTQTPPAAMTLSGHTAKINGLAFSPDGRTLATGSDDATARLWDLAKPDAAPVVLRGHEGGITALAFSPDGRTLATGGDDTTARLWSTIWLDAAPLLRGYTSGVRALAFSPDGRTLATGSDDMLLRLWDLNRPDADPIVLKGHEGLIYAVAFSPDGQRLASGSDDTTVRVWDLTTPNAAPVVLRGHRAPVAALTFSADGRSLISASFDATANRWDLTNPGAAPVALRSGDEALVAVALSPDGRFLAADSLDKSARLWDLTNPAAAPAILRGHADRVSAVAFSPDGRRLATGSYDSTTRVWDLANPAAPTSLVVLRGPTAAINTLAFSADGGAVVAGGVDYTARLWSVAGGDPVALQGHMEQVLAVAFSPDGRMIATGGADAAARLWSRRQDELVAAACATAGRNLAWGEWQQLLGADTPYHKTCPNLPISPSLIDSAAQMAASGDIQGALALARRVHELGADSEIPARSWSTLCWRGSLAGNAADLRDACERAVALAPDDGSVRESRGLSRALIGDLTGAVDDFRAYVAWGRQHGEDEQRIAQRDAWAGALASGRNPFDTATLEELRNE